MKTCKTCEFHTDPCLEMSWKYCANTEARKRGEIHATRDDFGCLFHKARKTKKKKEDV